MGENKSMAFAVYVHVCKDHIFGMNVLRSIKSSWKLEAGKVWEVNNMTCVYCRPKKKHSNIS